MNVGYCGRYCLTSARGILCFASRFCEWHSASGGGTVRYTQQLPLLNLKAQWGEKSIAEIGTSPQSRVVSMWQCISSLQLSQVQNLEPCSAFRCAQVGVSPPFNEIWLLLKKSVLPLLFFHSLVPHSCLSYAVITVGVLFGLLGRKWSGRNITFFCLILHWSIYCSDQLHASGWE